MMTQAEFLSKMLPHLERDGAIYHKYNTVKARLTKEEEYIETVTAEGLETVNTAKPGDYLVQNNTTAGEQYIVPAHKFEVKYEKLEDLEDGWARYKPNGRVIALQMTSNVLHTLELPNSFRFIAPWGEPMKCDQDDYVVCPPDKSEVYVIGYKEFLETYTLTTSKQ